MAAEKQGRLSVRRLQLPNAEPVYRSQNSTLRRGGRLGGGGGWGGGEGERRTGQEVGGWGRGRQLDSLLCAANTQASTMSDLDPPSQPGCRLAACRGACLQCILSPPLQCHNDSRKEASAGAAAVAEGSRRQQMAKGVGSRKRHTKHSLAPWQCPEGSSNRKQAGCRRSRRGKMTADLESQRRRIPRWPAVRKRWRCSPASCCPTCPACTPCLPAACSTHGADTQVAL